jgi:hypothetical protein
VRARLDEATRRRYAEFAVLPDGAPSVRNHAD